MLFGSSSGSAEHLRAAGIECKRPAP